MSVGLMAKYISQLNLMCPHKDLNMYAGDIEYTQTMGTSDLYGYLVKCSF